MDGGGREQAHVVRHAEVRHQRIAEELPRRGAGPGPRARRAAGALRVRLGARASCREQLRRVGRRLRASLHEDEPQEGPRGHDQEEHDDREVERRLELRCHAQHDDDQGEGRPAADEQAGHVLDEVLGPRARRHHDRLGRLVLGRTDLDEQEPDVADHDQDAAERQDLVGGEVVAAEGHRGEGRDDGQHPEPHHEAHRRDLLRLARAAAPHGDERPEARRTRRRSPPAKGTARCPACPATSRTALNLPAPQLPWPARRPRWWAPGQSLPPLTAPAPRPSARARADDRRRRADGLVGGGWLVHVAPGEEVEHVLREPFVGYPRQVVLALVQLERAVGDEPGRLLDDLPREELVLGCADQKHRHGDVGEDLPGIECHLRFRLDQRVAPEGRVGVPVDERCHERTEDPSRSSRPVREHAVEHGGDGLAGPSLAQQPGVGEIPCRAGPVRHVPGDRDGDATEAGGMAGGEVEGDHAAGGEAERRIDLPVELVGDQLPVVVGHVRDGVPLRHVPLPGDDPGRVAVLHQGTGCSKVPRQEHPARDRVAGTARNDQQGLRPGAPAGVGHPVREHAGDRLRDRRPAPQEPSAGERATRDDGQRPAGDEGKRGDTAHGANLPGDAPRGSVSPVARRGPGGQGVGRVSEPPALGSKADVRRPRWREASVVNRWGPHRRGRCGVASAGSTLDSREVRRAGMRRPPRIPSGAGLLGHQVRARARLNVGAGRS